MDDVLIPRAGLRLNSKSKRNNNPPQLRSCRLDWASPASGLSSANSVKQAAPFQRALAPSIGKWAN
ncbi:MAG TPA: hypothetical protein VKS24_09690 [Bradyrhizobium sp.]|nr:hypothetical protein [Bradyrhizobium sp.]